MYVGTKVSPTSTTFLYKMQMNGLGGKELVRDRFPSSKILMCYDSDSKTLFYNDPLTGYIMAYSAKGLHSSFCKRFKSCFTNFDELYYYINRLIFIIYKDILYLCTIFYYEKIRLYKYRESIKHQIF